MIDRAKLFAGLRHGLFPGTLTAGQVRGIGELLDVWERVGFKNLWYPAVNLANVFRETGGMMVPVREGFCKSDADARRYVTRQGYKYAAEVNGHVYYGRGRIQNTWDFNYKALTKRFGFDFYNDPDAILTDSKRDAELTVIGHIEGLWTAGKHPLSRYLDQSPPDLIGSRRGVNGTDHAAEIAGYAKQIYADLIQAAA